MKLLEEKTGLVTGGARGIGRAIAIAFAKHGANVAFSDMNADENFQNLEKELNAMGVKAKGYVSDASNFEASQAMVDEIVKDFGRIDILVNNAVLPAIPC